MSNVNRSKPISRRTFLAAAGVTAVGTLMAACGAPKTAAPAPAESKEEPKAAPAPAGPVEIRAHMVKKEDVSDWIQMGLDQDIDGFKAKNPNIKITLETVPGWTAEYFPKILTFAAAGTLGDLVWYPPRHRSHISWATQYDIVTDLGPMATAANYDMDKNFYVGANEANSFEGKQYWMSYISEPIVPIIAWNKTKVKAMGMKEPTDDMTFDELVEWGKSGTQGDVFGYYPADRLNHPFSGGPFLRQWGVEPTDKEGKKATFLDTKDNFVKALKYDYDLINTHKVSPSPAAGAINAPELFGAQKVLAVDIWPFRIQIYPATFKDFEMDFFLTPVVNKGEKRRNMLNEHVFGITTASKNPAEAFTFLTWIAGKEMNVQALVQGHKGPIARADVWDDQRIYENVPTYKKLAPIMAAIEADYLVANFRGEEFDNAYIAVSEALMLDKMTPDAAAEEIQKATQVVMDKEPA
jgi:ABC-type glycerol-3-phosphate transport system substrate-binding protein